MVGHRITYLIAIHRMAIRLVYDVIYQLMYVTPQKHSKCLPVSEASYFRAITRRQSSRSRIAICRYLPVPVSVPGSNPKGAYGYR